jgi:hypothetical protein
MSTNYGFEPTLDGLNNIDADSSTTTNIICDTIQINSSGTAPTVSALSNDTNIATTAWVTSHAIGSYVTLAGTQTITGQKTFSNANTYISGNTVTNSIQSSVATSDINIGTLLTTGDINFATGGISTNAALNWGSTSNSGNLLFRGGSFTFSGTGITTLSCGAAYAMDIATGQTSGLLSIGTATGRTAAINIGTGSTTGTVITIGSTGGGTTTLNCGTLNLSGTAFSRLGANMTSGAITIGGGASSATAINIGSTQTTVTSAINIGTVVTGNAPITIGSTASTTQTATHNAITTFSQIPSCSVVPTTANHLCNKTYVDSIGASILPLSNTFTGAVNAFQKITFANSDNTETGTLFQNNHTMSISTNAVSAASGSIAYPVTLSVTSLNTTTSVQISIPVNIFGYNSVDNSSTVTLTYTGATAYILKNGAVYSGTSSSTPTLDGVTTRTWNPTVSSKWAFWAYIGNIYFDVLLDQANVSTDTYSIGLTLTGTHSLGGLPVSELKYMYTGASIATYAFTTTHDASIPASQGFSGVDFTPFVSTTLTNPNQTEFSATNDIVITSPSTVSLISTAGNLENIANGSIAYTAETGSIGIQAASDIGISTNGDINIGTYAPSTNIYFYMDSTLAMQIAPALIYFMFDTACQQKLTVTGISTFNDVANFNGDVKILQDTYPPSSTSQIGYNNSATTLTDPMSNTLTERSNFTLPAKGVWLVICGYEWNTNTSNTVESKLLVLSTTSAGTTPAAYGLDYYEEINDAAGASGNRQKGCLSGVINATASLIIYVNARSQVSAGTNTELRTNISWTRLG